MPDYKEMYLIMVRASEKARRLEEKAMDLLMEAQQQCEEMYLIAPEPEITLLPPKDDKER